jgi:hypothetical protein
MSKTTQAAFAPDNAQVPVAHSAPPARKTKLSLFLDLISREEGATLKELTSATEWQPHTARAAITGLRKRGHEISCKRADGITRYSVGSSAQ